MFYPIFSLYAAGLHAKKSENSNESICFKTQKRILRHFLSKHPSARFLKKAVIWVNFKPSCCINFMQKIRKVICTDISQNLKTSFGVHFGPLLFNFKPLYCCNFMQKIRKRLCIDFLIIPEKPHLSPISAQVWPKISKLKFSPKI